jgi:hypothetical protein
MGAWEGLAALLVGALVARRARRGLVARAGAATLAWVALDLALGRFPVGSCGLETLLTALLVRGTASEPLAGLASRALLAAIGAAAIAAAGAALRYARRPGLRATRAAPLLLLAALACREGSPAPQRSYFAPAAPDEPAQVVRLAFDDPLRAAGAAHPVLAPDPRSSAVCLGCHASLVAPSGLPPARKGLHEIHAAAAGGAPGCSGCHAAAGTPGFPGEHPGRHLRREANQACRGCHTREGAPRWPRRLR